MGKYDIYTFQTDSCVLMFVCLCVRYQEQGDTDYGQVASTEMRMIQQLMAFN